MERASTIAPPVEQASHTDAGAPPVVLEVRDLHTHFLTAGGVARAVDGVSFDIRRGETFALVGESGCGKSVTALSMMQLVPKPGGFHPRGSIRLLTGNRTRDLLRMPEKEKRAIRGNDIAMIFQEPMTSLNPVFTIGQQIAEVVRLHERVSHQDAIARAVQMLEQVRMPDPASRVHEYPHQLSGGQKQRAMIAIALACKPALLIADEPTTALDVTIQAQILELMRDLQRDSGMSILLITHDLGVVAGMADRVGVMYAGKIVETADTATLYARPRHPYTLRLFDSLPDVRKRGQELAAIPGNVPPATRFPDHCRFAGRCEYEFAPCRLKDPQLVSVADRDGADAEPHEVRCFAYDKGISDEKPDVAGRAVVADARATSEPADAPAPPETLISVQDLRVHFGVKQRLKDLTAPVARLATISFIASFPVAAILALIGAMRYGSMWPALAGGVIWIASLVGLVVNTSGSTSRRAVGVGANLASLVAGLVLLSWLSGGTVALGLAAVAGWATVLYRLLEASRVKLRAVDGIDLTIQRGQTVALVGESGCGKTTAGKALLHLAPPTSGNVVFRGESMTGFFAELHALQQHAPIAVLVGIVGVLAVIGARGGPLALFIILLAGLLAGVGVIARLAGRERIVVLSLISGLLLMHLVQGMTVTGSLGPLAAVASILIGAVLLWRAVVLFSYAARKNLDQRVATFRRNCQIIFQDPYGSLNPRQMIGEILAEGMEANRIGANAAERDTLARRLLEQCGMPADAVNRYPHEFSGGQRQRIGVARALAVDPAFIVC
ncbi:MAG: oligopeptide/dipeptide ABC transporter ATP-binding protein, partial [Planctomycetota bacterium]